MPPTTLKQKISLIIFGICIAIILLELGLRVAGGALLFLEEQRSQKYAKAQDVYRILCLGESTTMLGGNSSYPRQLETILNERGRGKKFQVINKGVPGTNTTEILAHLKDNLERYQPHMVITMMGVNDEVLLEQGIFPKDERSFFDNLRLVKLFRLLSAHLFYRGSRHTDSLDEAQLKREIWLFPRNSWAYQELGRYYMRTNQYPKAEEILSLAVKRNPKSYWAYQALGDCFLNQKKYREAEELFKKAIGENPTENFGYQLLGIVYFKEDRFQEMEAIMKDALARYPRQAFLFSLMGQYYMLNRQFRESQEAFETAIRLEPENAMNYTDMGYLYGKMGNYDGLEAMFEKAFELKDENAPFKLTTWYLERGGYEKAEKFLKKILTKYPDNNRIYRGFAHLYSRWGKEELAQEFSKRADELVLRNQAKTATAENYQKITQMIQSFGTTYVCMQYPLRSIAPLKMMLRFFEGVIFVENEVIFRVALSKGKYEDYFNDNFAGDFGHCTYKGNYLIAENLANTILLNIK